MLLVPVLAAALFFLSRFVSAETNEAESTLAVDRKSRSNTACANELAGILYSPITPAHVYMAKIAAELKVEIAAVLNQIGSADYGLISTFMKKYDVKVTIDTFFGEPFTFFLTEAGIASAGPDTPSFSQTMSQLALGYDSFRFEPVLEHYFYGFVVQSAKTATGAIVIIEMSDRHATFLPVGCKVRRSPCEKELAGIAYAPQTTLSQYLKKISVELRNIADLLNTPLGVDFIEKFTIKYGTVVAIIDAFGNINEYADGQLVDSATPLTRDNVFSSRDARSVLNLGAFANEEVVAVYSFLSFSKEGQVYEVTVGRPKDDFLP